MATLQQTAMGGAARLVPAADAGKVGGDLLDVAAIDIVGEPAADPFLEAVRQDSVVKPNAAAVAPMTPASTLARYLGGFETPATEPRVSIRAAGRDLDLSADADDLGELILVLYVLDGWESVRAVDEALLARRAKVEADLVGAQQAVQGARIWVSGDVSGYPAQKVEAEAILPSLERKASALAEQTPRMLQALDEMLTAYRHQKTLLVERLDALIEMFELEARADLVQVLDESERVVRGELKRYAIKPLGDPQGTVTMADNDETMGLRKTLDQLARFRSGTIEPLQRELLAATGARAVVDLAAVMKLFIEIAGGSDPSLQAMMGDPLLIAVHAQEGDVRRQLEAAQLDYARLRIGVTVKYPIVHRIAENVKEKAEANQLAKTISLHADAVLRNIQTIRSEGAAEHPSPTAKNVLVAGDIDPTERVAAHTLARPMDVWDMPRVLDLTRYRLEGLGFDTPGQLGYTLLRRVMVRIPERRRERQEFWDAVSFALGLLGAFTGGSSLLVLGVLSGGARAIATIAEYDERLTLLNSSLDPAKALTDEDPYGWQLLVDLVFCGLDIYQATAALWALGPAAARAARLQTLREFLSKPNALKLLAAEEKLVKAEGAIAMQDVERLLKEEAAKAKQALAMAKERAAKSAKGPPRRRRSPRPVLRRSRQPQRSRRCRRRALGRRCRQPCVSWSTLRSRRSIGRSQT